MNQVILCGNISSDLELKSKNGASGEFKYCNFSVATNNKPYIKKDGTKIDQTSDFHDIYATNKMAEYISNNAKKGDKILINGKLTKNSYTDRNGIKRYVCQVVAKEVNLLFPRAKEYNHQVEQQPDREDYKRSTKTTVSDAKEPIRPPRASDNSTSDLPF